jgi:hypothetical protein
MPKEVTDGPQPRDKPWHAYQRGPNWKLLIPGYAGPLDDEELAFIVERLTNDTALRLWWGMPGRWKRVPVEVVKRLALQGSDESLAHNRKLARPRKKSQAPEQDRDAA